jgi:flagellar hook assembly protein FlgD
MFQVVPRGELRIEDVLNYPNPFETQTHFTFKLNQDAGAEIKIYTLDGRMIRHIDGILATAGFNMVAWDGRDEQGDELANGVYLYKLFVKSWAGPDRITKEVIGRLMIFR